MNLTPLRSLSRAQRFLRSQRTLARAGYRQTVRLIECILKVAFTRTPTSVLDSDVYPSYRGVRDGEGVRAGQRFGGRVLHSGRSPARTAAVLRRN